VQVVRAAGCSAVWAPPHATATCLLPVRAPAGERACGAAQAAAGAGVGAALRRAQGHIGWVSGPCFLPAHAAPPALLPCVRTHAFNKYSHHLTIDVGPPQQGAGGS